MRIGFGLLLVFLAALVAVPAQARDRDDVMAAAYHCAGVIDGKQWLDCYYGAAQPMRAELNLPPASKTQLSLAAAGPSEGDVRNSKARGEVMAGAAQCYLVVADRQWLDCYYNAAQPVRSLLGLSSTVVLSPGAVAPAFAVRKVSPVPNGGLSDWLGGSNKQSVVSRMVSYKFDRYRIFTVSLDNGQLWQQESGDTVYARWNKPAASYTVILTRGALGSIDLRVRGEPHIFKVTRLQ